MITPSLRLRESNATLQANFNINRDIPWAAVAQGVSDKRLKLKFLDGVSAKDLWGQETVVGDIVLVSKLTSDGYMPTEIHLTSV
ncbi:hypothetical protein AAFO90_21855 [Phaeobacter sp. CAU 1743]